jgi:hypothetical protein
MHIYCRKRKHIHIYSKVNRLHKHIRKQAYPFELHFSTKYSILVMFDHREEKILEIMYATVWA